MRDGLPDGWANAKLEDLTSFVRGVAYNKSQAREAPGPGLVLVLRAGNLQGGRIQTDSDLVYVPASCVSDAQRLRVGDNVVAMSSGSASVVGKAATVCSPLRDTSFGAFCGLFRPRAPDVERWAATYFQSEAYLSQVRESSAGVNINNLRSSNVLDFRLPLPPLNEQRRIVGKVEALMARSRRAKEALAAIPPLLDQLRQSILAAAFRGDLTADWRAQHPDVEPASELLQRIRTERRRRWEEAELAKQKAKGRTPGDDRWKAKYEEPEPVDDSELPELPEGWCWASVGDVTLNFDGIRVPVKQEDRATRQGKYPYYGASGVIDHVDSYLFDGTYLLIAEDGANLLSRSTPIAFQAHGKFWVNNHAHVVDCCAVSKDYLEAYLNGFDLTRFVSGTAQPKLTQKNLDRIPVPVAPPHEAEQLMAAVQRSLAGTGAVREALGRHGEDIAALDSAILAKAFRGELVPQDPNDEPASVLLERVRAGKDERNPAQKTQSATGSRGRGRK